MKSYRSNEFLLFVCAAILVISLAAHGATASRIRGSSASEVSSGESGDGELSSASSTAAASDRNVLRENPKRFLKTTGTASPTPLTTKSVNNVNPNDLDAPLPVKCSDYDPEKFVEDLDKKGSKIGPTRKDKLKAAVDKAKMQSRSFDFDLPTTRGVGFRGRTIEQDRREKVDGSGGSRVMRLGDALKKREKMESSINKIGGLIQKASAIEASTRSSFSSNRKFGSNQKVGPNKKIGSRIGKVKAKVGSEKSDKSNKRHRW